MMSSKYFVQPPDGGCGGPDVCDFCDRADHLALCEYGSCDTWTLVDDPTTGIYGDTFDGTLCTAHKFQKVDVR